MCLYSTKYGFLHPFSQLYSLFSSSVKSTSYTEAKFVDAFSLSETEDRPISLLGCLIRFEQIVFLIII